MAYPNGGTYPSATSASYGNVSALVSALPKRENGTTIEAAHMNLVQAEVIEIEQALGTNTSLLANPAGGSAYADLAAKLTGIYNAAVSNLATHSGVSTQVHGVGNGEVVGTTLTQTLSNKTLSSPAVNGGIINATSLSVNNVPAVDVSSSQTLSNKTLSSPVISGSGTIVAESGTFNSLNTTSLTVNGKPVLTSVDNSSLNGLTLTNATITGGTVNATTLQKSSVDVATISGAETLTNKTLSSPTFSGTVAGNFTFGGNVTFSSASFPSGAGLVPSGTVIMYAGNGAAPSGWLECDGATYAQSTYPSLASALGVASGNFTVPNLSGRFPQGTSSTTPYSSGYTTGGSTSITLTKANLPAHSHTITHDHTLKVSRDYNVNGWITGDSFPSGSAGHQHTGYYRGYSGGDSGNWDTLRPQQGGGYASEGNSAGHPDIVYGSSAHTHAVDVVGQSASASGNGSADGVSGSPISNIVPPYVVLRFLIKT